MRLLTALCLIVAATLHAQVTAPGGVISGRVIDIDSGEPIAGARVMVNASSAGRTMTGGTSSDSVLADAQGRFSFPGLRPGLYSVSSLTTEANVANRESAPTLVQLAAHQVATDVLVHSVRSAWISGRVSDETGHPVVGMSVVAFARTGSGSQPAFAILRSSVTNDLGDYTIDPLMPGDYILCACQWMAPLMDPGLVKTRGLLGPTPRQSDVQVAVDQDWRPPVRTFHPSAAQAGQATVITLRSNEGRTDAHIGVISSRLATVSGRVTGITPMAASAVRLQPVVQTGGPLVIGLEPDAVTADGTFRFQNVPPGNYRLLVRYRGPDPPTRVTNGLAQRLGAVPILPRLAFNAQTEISVWSDVPLTVDGRDVRDLQVPVTPALRFTGSVWFSEQGRIEPLRANGGTLERLDEPVDAPAVSSSVRADDEGRFELEGVIPGRYQFRWTILPPGLSLKSITFGGRDVTDLPFEIGDGPSSTFAVTMVTNDAGTVPGRVISSETTPQSILVVGFPADRRFWDEPAVAARRYVQARPDQRGQFQLEEVPPGEYVIAAISSREDSRAWRTRSRLEAFAAAGIVVTVGPGNNPPVEIRR